MGWSFSAIVNGSMLMTGRESHYFELNLSTDTRLQWVLFKIPSTHFTVNGFQGRLKKPRPFPLAIIDSCFKIIFVTSFHVSPLLHRPLEPFESVLALVSSCIPPLHPPIRLFIRTIVYFSDHPSIDKPPILLLSIIIITAPIKPMNYLHHIHPII